MYTRYMTLAFLTNGMGAFGLRVLAGAGLADAGSISYLAIWYLAGLLLAALVCFRRLTGLKAKEAGIGCAMAICSLGGQLGMALALSGRVPGFVVFPVATGGGLLLVVVVGVVVFREHMRALGYLGIAVGACALVLLAVPE